MMLPRSFRGRLALRFSLAILFLAVAGSAVGYVALRRILYDRLDATLIRLAGIEAAATADSPGDTVHFHDEIFREVSSSHETILSRYAEVWTLDGVPVARTRNLGNRDLPLPAAVLRRVIQTTRFALFDVQWEGRHYRAVLYPLGVIDPDHRPHLLQVAASTEQTETVLVNVLLVLLGLVLVGSLAGGAIGWWAAGFWVRPVLEIIDQAETLEAARTGHQIVAKADTEELQRLVSVLNAMLTRVDGVLDSQRRFLADAGHAIKTPLTILRGNIDVALRRERSERDYVGVLQETLQDLKDVSALAEDLITLARSDSGALVQPVEPVPLAPLLESVARKFYSLAQGRGMQLDIDVDRRLLVHGEGALLEQAVSNLVDNAVKYGRQGGRIVLRGFTDGDGAVAIRVTDNGPGMSAEERSQACERFYRGEHAQRVGPGSGLGLSIAKAIVQSLGGWLEISSAVGRGTTITLYCPGSLSPEDSPAERTAEPVEAR